MPRPPNLILIASLLLTASSQGAKAQGGGEPSREPILRVETRTHTDRITSAGIDAAERYLVTSSDDNTVRVWEIASGSLLKVLRIPIDISTPVEITSMALSPDG